MQFHLFAFFASSFLIFGHLDFTARHIITSTIFGCRVRRWHFSYAARISNSRPATYSVKDYRQPISMFRSNKQTKKREGEKKKETKEEIPSVLVSRQHSRIFPRWATLWLGEHFFPTIEPYSLSLFRSHAYCPSAERCSSAANPSNSRSEKMDLKFVKESPIKISPGGNGARRILVFHLHAR